MDDYSLKINVKSKKSEKDTFIIDIDVQGFHVDDVTAILEQIIQEVQSPRFPHINKN